MVSQSRKTRSIRCTTIWAYFISTVRSAIMRMDIYLKNPDSRMYDYPFGKVTKTKIFQITQKLK